MSRFPEGADIATVTHSGKKSSHGQKMRTLKANLRPRWENKSAQKDTRRKDFFGHYSGNSGIPSRLEECWASCPLVSGELVWDRILTAGSFLWGTLARVYKAAVKSLNLLHYLPQGLSDRGGSRERHFYVYYMLSNTSSMLYLFSFLVFHCYAVKNYGYFHFIDERTENQRLHDPLARKASVARL